MLIAFYIFKTGVQKVQEGQFVRLATGETVDDSTSFLSDDTLYNGTGLPMYDRGSDGSAYEVLQILSLEQLARKFSNRLLIARLLVATLWLMAGVMCVLCTLAVVSGRVLQWTDYIQVAVISVGAVLLTPQAINPILHDMTGKWVNLRTGASNLNGGCIIR